MLLCVRFVCDCPPELKFNVDAIDILIRSHLLNMREFDLHLVQVPQIFHIFANTCHPHTLKSHYQTLPPTKGRILRFWT